MGREVRPGTLDQEARRRRGEEQRRRLREVDCGVLPRQKLCIKWRGGTWDTAGAGPDQGTQGRAREQVEAGDSCSGMYCAVDSGVVSTCLEQVRSGEGWTNSL